LDQDGATWFAGISDLCPSSAVSRSSSMSREARCRAALSIFSELLLMLMLEAGLVPVSETIARR
jgi:hypothetical protein